MKSSDIKIGTTYGVIPSWDYSSADKKNPAKASRRALTKAELISLEKYEYKVYRSDNPDDVQFTLAPKGSRSVGYLVRSSDWANTNGQGDIYWLSRAQDIVAEYDQLETRWVKEEAEEKIREAQWKAEREENERRERIAQENAQRTIDAVKESLLSIIGERTHRIDFNISNRRNEKGEYKPTASCSMELRTLQSLVEKVLEARDMVA
jgi:vacuolar-type H+-ATPase subunit I/STV1